MTQTIDAGNGAVPQAGLMVREGFGTSETMALAELSSKAAAEQARAMVEARYVVALKRPRDIDRTRLMLIKDCKRPAFAEAARFAKPIGKEKVRGWSIRFAESAMRALGNLAVEASVLYDDVTRRIVRITCTDLEANATSWKDVTIEKTVERRNATGRTVLGKRLNAQGQTVYIVEASEDDLFNKESAISSKIRRQLILSFVPGDILDECLEAVKKTLDSETKIDPDAARKKLIDAFASVGVLPEQLAEYLGHPVAQIQPAELEDLRETYAALRDGETTWRDLVDARQVDRAPATASSSAPTNPTASATSKLAQKIQAKREAEQTAAASPDAVKVEGTTPSTKTPEPTPTPETSTSSTENTGSAPAAADSLTPEKFNELKSQLIATQAKLVDLVGKERAELAWKGTHGVKSLSGVKTRKAFDERLAAARELVEKAELSSTIQAARKEVLALPDGEAKLRTLGQDTTRDPMLLELRRAHEVLDVLLTAIELAKKPADAVEPAPNSPEDVGWSQSEPDEPGSRG